MGLMSNKKNKNRKELNETLPPSGQQQDTTNGGNGPKEEFPSTGISEVPSETLYMKAIRRPSIIPKSKPRKITPYPTSPSSSDHGSPYKSSPSHGNYKPRPPGPSPPHNNSNNYKK